MDVGAKGVGIDAATVKWPVRLGKHEYLYRELPMDGANGSVSNQHWAYTVKVVKPITLQWQLGFLAMWGHTRRPDSSKGITIQKNPMDAFQYGSRGNATFGGEFVAYTKITSDGSADIPFDYGNNIYGESQHPSDFFVVGQTYKFDFSLPTDGLGLRGLHSHIGLVNGTDYSYVNAPAIFPGNIPFIFCIGNIPSDDNVARHQIEQAPFPHDSLLILGLEAS